MLGPQPYLAKNAVLAHRPGKLCLDNAFTLIEGHQRAALDVNDLWIPDVAAQHPVESYRQLAGRCHFGHSLGLAVATVLILFTESLVQAHYRVRRFYQR